MYDSRLPELSQVEMLCSLLPSKVGDPLSLQGLCEDLEVSQPTITRWLSYLQELYYIFQVKPWTKSVVRTVKKEEKIYLYDWTEITEPRFRFENLIACHLLKACDFWTDTGEGHFELFYLRNKEKEEIDFLIVKDKKPWLCVEAKLSNTEINRRSIDKYQKYLGCSCVHVVKQSDVFRLEKSLAGKVLLISFHHLLSGLA